MSELEKTAGQNIRTYNRYDYLDKQEPEVYLPGLRSYFPLEHCSELLKELSEKINSNPELGSYAEIKRALNVLNFIHENEDYISQIRENDAGWLGTLVRNLNRALEPEPENLTLNGFTHVFEDVAKIIQRRDEAYTDPNSEFNKAWHRKPSSLPEPVYQTETKKSSKIVFLIKPKPRGIPEPIIASENNGLEGKIDYDPSECKKEDIQRGLAKCLEPKKKRRDCSHYSPSNNGKWNYCRY